MRLNRGRFTLRRLMIAVAIAATIFGVLIERMHRFEAIAMQYRREQGAHSSFVISLGRNPLVIERAEWLMQMVETYERAGRYPWLPVAPDPPEPK